MSLHYVIDGNNLIHHPSFRRNSAKKIRDLRLALLEFISRNKLCGSHNNKVTVVFDGYAQVPEAPFGIKVVSSGSESADEKIYRIIEHSQNLKHTVVVSDDKQIKSFAKASGAAILAAEEFLGRYEKLQAKGDDGQEVKLNYTQMQKVNLELRKLWLR